MPTYSIDSRVVGPGTGTRADPWPSFASLPTLVAGDVVEIARGSVLTGQYTVPVSGAVGNPITYTSYGTGPLPVLDGGGVAGYVIGAAVARNYITITNIALRNGAANGTDGLVYFPSGPLGIVVTDCEIGQTLGYGIHLRGGSLHSILRNTIVDCVRAGVYFVGSSLSTISANNISNVEYGIVIDGNVSVAALTITNNLLDGLRNARGLGGIWWSPYTNAINASGWRVLGNVCRNFQGTTQGIGIRITGQIQDSRIASNECVDNRRHGIFVGGFENTLGRTMAGLVITGNVTNRNGEFGIVISRCDGGQILSNICDDNGGGATGYGRGIELTGPGGVPNGSKRWLIHGNIARRSKARAGTNHNNGTEGVGIGIDDATSECVVTGNWCEDNEGHGIQPNEAANIVVAGNVLVRNFRLPVPAGLTVPTALRAEIFLGTGAANQLYANNTIICNTDGGPALYGISDLDFTTNTGTVLVNNVIVGARVAGILRHTGTLQSYSAFARCQINVASAATGLPEGNGTGSITSGVEAALADNYSLRVSPTTSLATLATDNPLALAGTYIQGVALRNGRARPGYFPIGAYQAVLPRQIRV